MGLPTKQGYNGRTVSLKVPEGAAASAPKAGSSTFIKPVQLHMSVGVDGTNAPPATSFLGHPCTCTRVSQGLYRFGIGGLNPYGVRAIVTAFASLQKSVASVLGAEVASFSTSAGTVDVRVINRSTGAVADPVAAGANERLHLVVTFDNGPV